MVDKKFFEGKKISKAIFPNRNLLAAALAYKIVDVLAYTVFEVTKQLALER